MTIDFSKPITTRDGRAVRILCTDGPHSEFKVIGICSGDMTTSYWSVDGKYCSQGTPRLEACNLINPPVKRRRWVKVMKSDRAPSGFEVSGYIFNTKEEAEQAVIYSPVIAYVQLPEWEEPE